MKYSFYMEIFMNFHYKVYIKPKMIVEMENYKFESRVTLLKAIDTITPTLLSYIFLEIVLLLLPDAMFGFKY